jgi:hypothetical protein
MMVTISPTASGTSFSYIQQGIHDNGSFTIPASALGSVSGECILHVLRYRYSAKSSGGKDYYAVAEVVKQITITQKRSSARRLWSASKLAEGSEQTCIEARNRPDTRSLASLPPTALRERDSTERSSPHSIHSTLRHSRRREDHGSISSNRHAGERIARRSCSSGERGHAATCSREYVR